MNDEPNYEQPPNNPKEGFMYLHENQELHGLPPISSCNHFSQNKTNMGKLNIIEICIPFSHLSRGIIAPYLYPCLSCIQRCILLIYIKVLHF
jgi:hypothetical protein